MQTHRKDSFFLDWGAIHDMLSSHRRLRTNLLPEEADRKRHIDVFNMFEHIRSQENRNRIQILYGEKDHIDW